MLIALQYLTLYYIHHFFHIKVFFKKQQLYAMFVHFCILHIVFILF